MQAARAAHAAVVRAQQSHWLLPPVQRGVWPLATLLDACPRDLCLNF
jgi:hypothetical protein